MTQWHRSFYTQTLLHADPFTHRRVYTQTLLHTDTFIHRHLYTQTLLHTVSQSLYTETLLHTDHDHYHDHHGHARSIINHLRHLFLSLTSSVSASLLLYPKAENFILTHHSSSSSLSLSVLFLGKPTVTQTQLDNPAVGPQRPDKGPAECRRLLKSRLCRN